MSGGAVEVNPVMAVLVSGELAVFVALKMARDRSSVMLMVFLARYRFMRLVRVEVMLYVIFVGLCSLIAHEMRHVAKSPGRCTSCNFCWRVTFHIVSR